ncbi:hypothetical protein IJ541_06695 [bacterium]|nr:hypothetical protein [bacterium]
MDSDNEKLILQEKKDAILKALGEIVLKHRKQQNKGINIFSYEYDIGNGLLSKLEKGQIDTKLTTLWKLANAFNYKCSDFVKLIEEKLPQDFDLYN